MTFFSRRTIIAGAITSSTFPARLLAADAARVLAGTYAREDGAGFVPLTVEQNGLVACKAFAAIRNASFGAHAPRHGLRYLVDEQRQGSLGIYDRALRQLTTHSTLGSNPCHAALSPDGSVLAVANYSSGSVAVWRLDPATGHPRKEAQLIRHGEHDPRRAQGTEAHAHWVGFSANGRTLHAVDLGLDAVFAHRVDPQAGTISATSIAYWAAAGSGPRHLARHPRLPVAYLVAEMANTVTVLRASADATFTQADVISTVPADLHAASFAGHLVLNRAGTRLYVSNRGHDSIAVFGIEPDGRLQLLQHVGCGGHWPRFFLLLEDRKEMLVANQRSGNVASLQIAGDGRLHLTDRSVAVPGVAFLTL